MKIAHILNIGLNHINLVKFSKNSEISSGGGLTHNVLQNHEFRKDNVFFLERGTLNERDIKLVRELKDVFNAVSEMVSGANKNLKTKINSYKDFINSPNGIIALKVDNPKVTAISASVKNKDGEEYFDIILNGYFGDKKRFLINNDGEIIKTVNPNFFADATLHAYDRETLFYSQHEINNLGINKYINMFKSKLSDFKDFLSPNKPLTLKTEPKKVFDSVGFLSRQKEMLDSVYQNFNTLYDNITHVSKTSIQRRKVSDICGVKLHKKYPLMQIDNINPQKDSVLLNFIEFGNKRATRIVVFSNENKQTRLFLDGQLVEEKLRDNSNPFTISRIVETYPPEETNELGMPELLESINKKLSDGLKQFNAMFGKNVGN